MALGRFGARFGEGFMSQLVLAEQSFNLVHVALAHEVQNLGGLGRQRSSEAKVSHPFS